MGIRQRDAKSRVHFDRGDKTTHGGKVIIVSWGYDTKNKNYVLFFDGQCRYADEIVIDGETYPREQGEADVSTWTIDEQLSVNIDKPHKTIIFKAFTKKEKPALGVMPCYIAAEKRISDLTDAIKRQIKAEKPNYDLIKRWADEIGNQCDLIEYDRCWDDE